jgi:hypothetical protein
MPQFETSLSEADRARIVTQAQPQVKENATGNFRCKAAARASLNSFKPV